MRVPLDLSEPSRLHVVGVGGPGMSAIAIVLAEMGHAVSGSDLREQPVLDRLRAGGVDVRVGHDRAVVHGCRAVTRSSAVPAHNIELQEAEAIGVTVLRRGEERLVATAEAGDEPAYAKALTTLQLWTGITIALVVVAIFFMAAKPFG